MNDPILQNEADAQSNSEMEQLLREITKFQMNNNEGPSCGNDATGGPPGSFGPDQN